MCTEAMNPELVAKQLHDLWCKNGWAWGGKIYHREEYFKHIEFVTLIHNYGASIGCSSCIRSITEPPVDDGSKDYFVMHPEVEHLND